MLSTLFGMSATATNTDSALNAYYQHVAEVTFDADTPLSESLQFDPGWDGTLCSIYSLSETSQGLAFDDFAMVVHLV